MKKIKLTKKELEYLAYILKYGFQVNQDLPNKEYNKEIKILKKLQDKIN